ncbi:mycofactocin dehydrogenase MftG [Leucobacter sp. W1153]|uniref:mycofactocin dehydrogenase MftG n=1 Tax=Leucobacter sp. W1153 TaxID=3439064 RepID=UPI003F395E6D
MTHTLVVGAGAAGSALAARLSEDPLRQVTLIEAGAAGPTPQELLDGATLPAVVPGHFANWGYAAELMQDVPHTVPRGRLLGGSSGINGGYFVRGRPADFTRWAEVGGAEWSYERALPLLQSLEHDIDFGDQPGHGARGPVRVARPDQTGVLTTAFYRAACELGFSAEPDKNATGVAPGVGPVPSNIIDGVRVNMAMAYLEPARDRPNLRVLGDTRVLRLRLAAGRVTGVETSTGDISADEVVLCAGSVATPQLLMLSGIGPAEHLTDLGIPVVTDLPVGQGFSDHPNLTVDWIPTRPLLDERERFAFPAALNFDSSGPAAEHPEGDIEVLLSVKSASALFTGKTKGTPGDEDEAGPAKRAGEMQLFVALQQPRGRGRLSLASADPLAQPRIEYRYLEDSADVARMRIAVRAAADLLRSQAFAPLFRRFASLDAVCLADDELLDAWIRSHLGTAIHLSGSAPMGPVVDGAGRVHGIEGLRVADTSLLPTVPSRGTFNTAVFIGELIARQIRAPHANP